MRKKKELRRNKRKEEIGGSRERAEEAKKD